MANEDQIVTIRIKAVTSEDIAITFLRKGFFVKYRWVRVIVGKKLQVLYPGTSLLFEPNFPESFIQVFAGGCIFIIFRMQFIHTSVEATQIHT